MCGTRALRAVARALYAHVRTEERESEPHTRMHARPRARHRPRPPTKGQAQGHPCGRARSWAERGVAWRSMGSYEGTGRSLSLKLVQQLREKDRHAHAQPQADGSSARVLREIALETPIRHARSLQRVFAAAEWCGTRGRAGGRAGGPARFIARTPTLRSQSLYALAALGRSRHHSRIAACACVSHTNASHGTAATAGPGRRTEQAACREQHRPLQV